jgi:glutathione S-transferase
MITHTVLFRLRRPKDEQALPQFVAALRDFASDAPHAVSVDVTESRFLRGEGPRVADAMLTVTLASADDFGPYQASDAHQALIHDVLEPSCEGWWSVQAES